MAEQSAPVPLLGWSQYGDPDGVPVLYHHGMPGARTEAELFHAQAQRNGLRLIVPDRPGIGGTAFLRVEQITELVSHYCALMDHLAIRDCHQVGWSSGGPVALAMAAIAPERVTGLTIMASYTHFHEAGLKDSLVRPFARYTRFTRGYLVSMLVSLIRIAGWTERVLPWVYLRFLSKLCAPSDWRVLSQPSTRRVFMAAQTEAFRQGTSGPRQDFALQYEYWGFRLAEVKTPVVLYQGLDDPIVVPGNAEDLLQRLPRCDLRTLDGEGHMFPFRQDFQERWMAELRRQ